MRYDDESIRVAVHRVLGVPKPAHQIHLELSADIELSERRVYRVLARMLTAGQVAHVGPYPGGEWCRAGAVFLRNGYEVAANDGWGGIGEQRRKSRQRQPGGRAHVWAGLGRAASAEAKARKRGKGAA